MLPVTRIIFFGSDILKLKSFYCNHFGHKVVEENGIGWVVLDNGGAQIALHKIGAEYVTSEPFIAENNVKLVFSYSGDLKQFRSQLLSNGVDVGEIRQFPGFPGQFLDGRDPEGNVFQIATAK